MSYSILCTICMRSGSKGVKNKNIKLINNKPLMYYTIKQALKSKIFNQIVVSTDSKKLLKCAKLYGAEGWFIRPKKLSLDVSPKIAVIKHALLQSEKYYNKKFNFIVDLDETGINQLVIFQDSITGLEVGDEIGVGSCWWCWSRRCFPDRLPDFAEPRTSAGCSPGFDGAAELLVP